LFFLISISGAFQGRIATTAGGVGGGGGGAGSEAADVPPEGSDAGRRQEARRPGGRLGIEGGEAKLLFRCPVSSSVDPSEFIYRLPLMCFGSFS